MQRLKRLGIMGLLLVVAWGAEPGRAEGDRVELTGLALVGKSPRNLRQAAMRSGVRDAVMNRAVDMVGLGPDDSTAAIRRALGPDLLVYAERFRILEDQGERPRLGETGRPTGETVYAVWLEVYVDRVRVARQLRQAGLIDAAPKPAPAGRLLLELRGVGSYATLQTLEGVLRDLTSVGRVVPRAFSSGRVILEVETRDTPGRLLERFFARAPDDLLLRRLPSDGATTALVVEVDSRP